MKYPYLSEVTKTREQTNVFGGYHHNLHARDGEFYDMKNLSSSNYPLLSVRPRRGFVTKTGHGVQGLIGKDVLCWVYDSDFVIGDKKIPLGLSIDEKPKTLVSMGAYVIIMPDKKYVNTADTSDFGSLEASFTTSGTVTFSLCKQDGTGYGDMAVGDTAPKSPANMALWLDTSDTPHVLKQYSEASAMWVVIATTYIKISSTGIGTDFSAGDGITLEGVESDALADLNGTMVLHDKGDDYLVITGILDEMQTQETPITVSRRMPNVDFITESGNRLWGCRYGTDIHGKTVNEIYASKLGDFKNWNTFMGISTDSYAASVGTDGAFTGAVTHLGHPIFFKENCMHKVYGSYPSNFQIQDTVCRGVQNGCAESLATVNEILYYKSRNAVCAYDGSLPIEISAPLGDPTYSDAAAGALGNKYYISMRLSDGRYHFFVYDTARGLWHKEDDTHASQFASAGGELYFLAYGKIQSVLGTGTKEEGALRFMAETGMIGTDSPDRKYIARLDIRLSLSVSDEIDFYIEYDSSGKWEHLQTVFGHGTGSFSIPIRPRRCDHLRLRMEGKGDVKIFSLCKTMEEGSAS